jgi:hypothetical protein
MSEETKIKNEIKEEQIHSKIINLEELQKVINEMISNEKYLKNGNKIFENYILQRNFHVGILKNNF